MKTCSRIVKNLKHKIMFRALSPKSWFMYCAHVLIRGEELCRSQTFEHESAGRRRWYFKTLKKPRNRFRGTDSASLYSLAWRVGTQPYFYSVPIPALFSPAGSWSNDEWRHFRYSPLLLFTSWCSPATVGSAVRGKPDDWGWERVPRVPCVRPEVRTRQLRK